MTTKDSSGPAGGLTLVELSMVIAMFGIMMLISVPLLMRGTGDASDPKEQLSLWTEVLLERSALRGEVFWVEVDAMERTFEVLQPVVVQTAQQNPNGTGPVVEMVEVQDRFFPTKKELDEDEFEVVDIQGPDGSKHSTDPFYIVVYPYGWIDPATIHLRRIDDGEEFSGMINSVTGRIDWQEGYRERLRGSESF